MKQRRNNSAIAPLWAAMIVCVVMLGLSATPAFAQCVNRLERTITDKSSNTKSTEVLYQKIMPNGAVIYSRNLGKFAKPFRPVPVGSKSDKPESAWKVVATTDEYSKLDKPELGQKAATTATDDCPEFAGFGGGLAFNSVESGWGFSGFALEINYNPTILSGQVPQFALAFSSDIAPIRWFDTDGTPILEPINGIDMNPLPDLDELPNLDDYALPPLERTLSSTPSSTPTPLIPGEIYTIPPILLPGIPLGFSVGLGQDFTPGETQPDGVRPIFAVGLTKFGLKVDDEEPPSPGELPPITLCETYPDAEPDSEGVCVDGTREDVQIFMAYDINGGASNIAFQVADDATGQYGSFIYQDSRLYQQGTPQSPNYVEALYVPPGSFALGVSEVRITVETVKNNEVVGLRPLKLTRTCPPPPPPPRYDWKFGNEVVGNPSFPYLQLTGQNGIPIAICTDGSNATVATFLDNSPSPNAANAQFKIMGSNNQELGSFDYITSTATERKARYRHPSDPSIIAEGQQNSTATFQVTINNSVVATHPVQFYREAIVFLHGLYGDISHLAPLANTLTAANEWPLELTYIANYKPTNSEEFAINSSRLPEAIDALFRQTRATKFSAGKAAVISHSMGGALTRCYIQGSCGATTFRNDINRWISMNGVLHGTYISKALLDADLSFGWISSVAGMPAYNGAIASLAYDSPEFVNDINGSKFNANMSEVPFHAIVSTFDPTDANIDYGAEYGNGKEFNLRLYVRYMAFTQRADMKTATNNIFNNEPNDFAVPLRSQTGGMDLVSASYYTRYDGAEHTHTLTTPLVQSRVRALLKQNPSSSSFTIEGLVKPSPAFVYTFDAATCSDPLAPNCLPIFGRGSILERPDLWKFQPFSFVTPRTNSASPAQQSVSNQSQSGQMQFANVKTETTQSTASTTVQSVSIQTAGASNVASVVFAALTPSGEIASAGPYFTPSPTFSFTFTNEIPGTVTIVAMSKLTDGNVGIDVAYLNIDGTTLPQDVSLSTTIDDVNQDPLFYAARQSVTTSNFTVNSGFYTELTAGTQIHLAAGTRILPGSGFHASIQGDLATAQVYTAAAKTGETITTKSPVKSQPTSGTTSASARPVSATPTEYGLKQNYPNPFNPATTIQYALPQQSKVSLRIYDVLGRVVADLVNETKVAGFYEARFDASRFASGVYFYRLQAGDFVQTKKMLLLK